MKRIFTTLWNTIGWRELPLWIIQTIFYYWFAMGMTYWLTSKSYSGIFHTMFWVLGIIVYLLLGAIFLRVTRLVMSIKHPTEAQRRAQQENRLYQQASADGKINLMIHQDIREMKQDGCLSLLFSGVIGLAKAFVFIWIFPWALVHIADGNV